LEPRDLQENILKSQAADRMCSSSSARFELVGGGGGRCEEGCHHSQSIYLTLYLAI
jgi:hypothetical protein